MKEKFQAECIKNVWMKGGERTYKCFKKGVIYNNCDPGVYPNPHDNIALIDARGEEHFMDWKWFNEHFKKL